MTRRFVDPSPVLVAVTSFALGACATVATQSVAAPATPEARNVTQAVSSPADGSSRSATVVALSDAESQVAPSGKARVQHLARGDNAYVGRLEMKAGAAVPEHRDATEEYIHVLEGSGTLRIEDRSYELSPGTTVFMPANAKVSYQNADADMVALQIFAGPGPSAKYQGWDSTTP
jgi:quercetin dioxygenase-like cupin family protein